MPTLQQVDSYPVPSLLVPRIAKLYHRTDTDAERMVREAKRMLFLSVVSKEPIAPSNIVDEAWHEMLMFTRFYQEFAKLIEGFIHHDPTDPANSTNVPGTTEPVLDDTFVYRKTKENYRRFFGEDPDPRFWP